MYVENKSQYSWNAKSYKIRTELERICIVALQVFIIFRICFRWMLMWLQLCESKIQELGCSFSFPFWSTVSTFGGSILLIWEIYFPPWVCSNHISLHRKWCRFIWCRCTDITSFLLLSWNPSLYKDVMLYLFRSAFNLSIFPYHLYGSDRCFIHYVGFLSVDWSIISSNLWKVASLIFFSVACGNRLSRCSNSVLKLNKIKLRVAYLRLGSNHDVSFITKV